MLKKLLKNFDPDSLKKYVRNTSWLLTEKVMRLISGFFVGIYVARHLGKAQYGQLNNALSLSGIFLVFAALGLYELLTRELLKYPESQHKIMSQAFVLKLLASLGAFIVCNGLSFYLYEAPTDRWLILILSATFFFYAFDVFSFYFQAQVKSDYIAKLNIMALAVSSALKLWFIFENYDVIWFALATLIEQAVLHLGFWIVFEKKERPNEFRFLIWESKLVKQLTYQAPLLIFTGLALTLYHKIDQVMIKQMLNDAENGVYSFAVRISEMWYFIPGVIGFSVYPAIQNAFMSDKARYFKRIQQLFDLFALMGWAAALFVTFFGEFTIQLVGGGKYDESVPVFLIHIWGGLIIATNYVSSRWLITEDLIPLASWRYAGGAVLNIGMNLYMIPHYGIEGAAWATVISHVVVGYLSFAFHPRARIIFFMITKSVFLISPVVQTFSLLKNGLKAKN